MLNDKIGFILYCKNCLNRDFSYGIVPSPENVCPYCGGRMYAIGPLWIGELHDKEIIGRMLQEIDHIRLNTDRESRKLLEFCKDELLVPGFYDYHSIAKVHKIKLEPIRSVISNLVSAGYNASRTHFMGTGIKTDANIYELLKVIKR
jgi:tRNA (guanine26-N2/guanine27-N2)-dimethyltransferase